MPDTSAPETQRATVGYLKTLIADPATPNSVREYASRIVAQCAQDDDTADPLTSTLEALTFLAAVLGVKPPAVTGASGSAFTDTALEGMLSDKFRWAITTYYITPSGRAGRRTIHATMPYAEALRWADTELSTNGNREVAHIVRRDIRRV